ncbi:unnamed protein product [Rotaria sordida]|uniref:UDP-N-acetylglucosamine--dolichyl-phosphate N-acetylglucosaminephosphotransferase n=1 Tax=Rotaria sordida TaxID=392033 RepID=A0A813V245_9BILA|nr:unnamed protein product [Rotaria sordida]CAF3663870.1 unnamed protein product [Rotaria sordida]
MKQIDTSVSTTDHFNRFTIACNILISIVGGLIVNRSIPILKDKFIRAQLWGYDLNKRNSREIKIAESQSVIAADIFLILMFIMIAIVFSEHLHPQSDFPHNKFIEYLAALLSICCMILLGFADDVLDLRWSVKLLFPLIASLPLLLVYFANYHSITIILPKPVRPILDHQWNLAVFCTNAINILAGINGLEVGQSIVIAISILIFNFIELQVNLMSLQLDMKTSFNNINQCLNSDSHFQSKINFNQHELYCLTLRRLYIHLDDGLSFKHLIEHIPNLE